MARRSGESLLHWADLQLELAHDIVDNPGGGLVSATQAIGQVKSALREADETQWAGIITLLEDAEDAAIHRDFARCRDLLVDAGDRLDPGQ